MKRENNFDILPSQKYEAVPLLYWQIASNRLIPPPQVAEHSMVGISTQEVQDGQACVLQENKRD